MRRDKSGLNGLKDVNQKQLIIIPESNFMEMSLYKKNWGNFWNDVRNLFVQIYFVWIQSLTICVYMFFKSYFVYGELNCDAAVAVQYQYGSMIAITFCFKPFQNSFNKM